jgi:hypothetical protein
MRADAQGRKRPSTMLLISRPYPGEPISSILDRVSVVYGGTGLVIAQEVSRRANCKVHITTEMDLDDPPAILLYHLENAMRLKRGSLSEHVIHDGPEWLLPSARGHYCYGCVMGDVNAGRQPYSRREWSKVHSTICAIHKMPLFNIRRRHTSNGPLLPVDLYKAARDDLLGREMLSANWVGRDFSSLLLDWETSLGRHIGDYGELTTSSDQMARLLGKTLVLFGTIHGPFPDYLSAGLLMPSESGWSLNRQSGGLEVVESATGRPAWDRFRGIRHVALRRAVLWLATATLNGYLDLDEPVGVGRRPIRTANLDWWLRRVWPRMTVWAIPAATELWLEIHSSGRGMRPEEIPAFVRGFGGEFLAA